MVSLVPPVENIIFFANSTCGMWVSQEYYGFIILAIATLGAEIPYNPQGHRLQTGTANPGDLVKVQSPGYTYQGKLLHRAEVAIIPLS